MISGYTDIGTYVPISGHVKNPDAGVCPPRPVLQPAAPRLRGDGWALALRCAGVTAEPTAEPTAESDAARGGTVPRGSWAGSVTSSDCALRGAVSSSHGCLSSVQTQPGRARREEDVLLFKVFCSPSATEGRCLLGGQEAHRRFCRCYRCHVYLQRQPLPPLPSVAAGSPTDPHRVQNWLAGARRLVALSTVTACASDNRMAWKCVGRPGSLTRKARPSSGGWGDSEFGKSSQVRLSAGSGCSIILLFDSDPPTRRPDSEGTMPVGTVTMI
jgi:hypothetical protein